MVSEASAPIANEVDAVLGKSASRSFPNKKIHGKVPKKIHKAEREKMKRDQLNELFLELENALEPARQNNGKASILGDASRILRDLLSQVESLKQENATLLSESNYVTIEKNELKEENSVLESQIGKLKTELRERTQIRPSWDATLPHPQQTDPAPPLEDHRMLPVVDPALPPTPAVGPVLVIPLQQDLHGFVNPDTAKDAPKLPSHVSRPHARYPTPADSWPSKLLARNTETVQETEIIDKGEQGSGS